jgi:hypothetical protein
LRGDLRFERIVTDLEAKTLAQKEIDPAVTASR